jgi:hypothetical protein
MSCPISGFQDADFGAKNKLNGQNKKAAEDPRAMIALARVNWLHSHYNIVRFQSLRFRIFLTFYSSQSNEDYLYTLSLFISEPGVHDNLVLYPLIHSLMSLIGLGTQVWLAKAIPPGGA